MRWILIKTKYKQKMQIILQYKKLWGKLEINILKANVGKYTRKGRNVNVSEEVKRYEKRSLMPRGWSVPSLEIRDISCFLRLLLLPETGQRARIFISEIQ